MDSIHRTSDNILILLVDQWPAGCFGHAGADIATPNIDKLAATGTVFDNAYTTCPLCSPARGAFFTSRWHHQTGMIDNVGIGYSEQQPLPATQETWLDSAVREGYHVGYFGKWHLGMDGPIQRGVHRHPDTIEPELIPFDSGEDVDFYNVRVRQYAEAQKSLLSGRAPFYGTKEMEKSATDPFIVAADACRFIDEYAESDINRPFLLTVSINDPHFPHYLPKEAAEEFSPDFPDLPENLNDDFGEKPWFHSKPWWPSMDTSALDEKEWRDLVRHAYMHRTLVDEALGRVLDKLELCGLEENTRVVFVSDHGDMCGGHNRFDKGPYFYDEVWRIPLIIKAPTISAAHNPSPVSILDVGRTISEWIVGGDKPAADGRDLSPLLGEESPPKAWTSDIYGMYDRYNGMSFAIRAVTDGRYKYVFNPQSIDELYDTEQDPGEMRNLADVPEYKNIKASLAANLKLWMERTGDPLLSSLDELPEAGTVIRFGRPGP